ncbi:MAG: DUF262 domain-containing protein [Dehalococcoidia bacterium]
MSSSNFEVILERFNEAQEELVLQPADLSLRTIANMVASGAIDLTPNFQRRERWQAHQQSALIESFLLNIPVPPIYLAEDDLGTYAVIDGKQRITAVNAYLTDDLELRSVGAFPELDGLSFSELPRQIQNALDLRPLRAVTLLKQSNPDLKYEVFHRLNSGGEILNPQEIRNVVYRGPLNDLIYELAGEEFLRDRLKISSEKSSAYRNMQDAEYVLRFLTLASSWRTFSGDLARSMNHFMQNQRMADEKQLSGLARSFTRALRGCESIWGEAAFRRPDGNGWRHQTLAGMYDAQMLAVSEISQPVLDALIGKREKVIERTRGLFGDVEFEAAVRQATNTPSRILLRTTRMIDMLRDVVA